MQVKQFDKVRLSDGRIGYVVDCYSKEGYGIEGYEIEPVPYDGTDLTIGVKSSDVIEVMKG